LTRQEFNPTSDSQLQIALARCRICDYEPAVLLNWIFGTLVLLSLALAVWQWLVARRFPLHQRLETKSPAPSITLFKPLKGCDPATADCLRSWFTQEYTGQVQILFAVTSSEDPAKAVVEALLREFSNRDAQIVVTGPPTDTNAKVSKLAELEKLAKYDVFIVSDADVRVPPDLLSIIAALLPAGGPQNSNGLVTCFYRMANPTTMAMRWEATAINADFWSQVLQSQSLKPLDFALGAVMATRRDQLKQLGGFKALANCLADDYQLGNRIARNGHSIALAPVVVECWSEPMGWAAVWKHQLRWARTIRVCQPAPYFFSILSNPTFWPLLWAIVSRSPLSLSCCLVCLGFRIWMALDLQQRLAQTSLPISNGVMALLKDLLQAVIWAQAFIGNSIEWRGERMRLNRDGTLSKI
jgi:ceramide glucosyltransferase